LFYFYYHTYASVWKTKLLQQMLIAGQSINLSKLSFTTLAWISPDDRFTPEPLPITLLKASYFSIALKTITRFIFSLQWKTKDKLALNQSVFYEMGNCEYWAQFFPHASSNKLIKLFFIFFPLYILGIGNEFFNEGLPSTTTLRPIFNHKIGSNYDILFIIFVDEIAINMLSEYIFFGILPRSIQNKQFTF